MVALPDTRIAAPAPPHHRSLVAKVRARRERRKNRAAGTVSARPPRAYTANLGRVAELGGGVCAVVAAVQALGSWAGWAIAALVLILWANFGTKAGT